MCIDADAVKKMCVYMQMLLQSCVYRCRCGYKAVCIDANAVAKNVCIDVDVAAKLRVKMQMW